MSSLGLLRLRQKTTTMSKLFVAKYFDYYILIHSSSGLPYSKDGKTIEMFNKQNIATAECKIINQLKGLELVTRKVRIEILNKK